MNTILDQLFESDIAFAQDQESERRYTSALEAVCQAEKTIEEKLPPEQYPMVKSYMEEVLLHQKLDRKIEFERGFLLAGKVFLELIFRQSETSAYSTKE